MTDCQSCDELKKTSPEFVLHGIREKECKSLQKNTGLNPKLPVLHNNCQDLNNMNDCLLGYLGEELPAVNMCDIKDFIQDFLNNQRLMNKSLICSDCGQWDLIEKMLDALLKIIEKLKEIGVWEGDLEGGFIPGKGIAGGNINLFGGSPDGAHYIRTNNKSTENDLAGGINAALLKQLKAELKEELKAELREGE